MVDINDKGRSINCKCGMMGIWIADGRISFCPKCNRMYKGILVEDKTEPQEIRMSKTEDGDVFDDEQINAMAIALRDCAVADGHKTVLNWLVGAGGRKAIVVKLVDRLNRNGYILTKGEIRV